MKKKGKRRTRLTLIESHRRYSRTWRNSALSVAAHIAFVALLVSMPKHVAPLRLTPQGAQVERLVYLKLPVPVPRGARVAIAPPRVRAPARNLARTAPPLAPSRNLVATAPPLSPDELSAKLDKLIKVGTTVVDPPATLSAPSLALSADSLLNSMPGVGQFTGDFSVAGALRRAGGRSGRAEHPGPYSEIEVDAPAAALRANPVPRYPEMLRAAGVEGNVIAEFVVDSTGHVERSTLRIVSSTHALFARAVKDALLRARFYPALIGDRAVAMRARQPFWFRLIRE